jgi:hypothetical protein
MDLHTHSTTQVIHVYLLDCIAWEGFSVVTSARALFEDFGSGLRDPVWLCPDKKNKFDEEVDEMGVRILIDPGALMHVVGTKMDFVEDRLK